LAYVNFLAALACKLVNATFCVFVCRVAITQQPVYSVIDSKCYF
jgi:hypothetical protein